MVPPIAQRKITANAMKIFFQMLAVIFRRRGSEIVYHAAEEWARGIVSLCDDSNSNSSSDESVFYGNNEPQLRNGAGVLSQRVLARHGGDGCAQPTKV
jgi:hypothetical protein